MSRKKILVCLPAAPYPARTNGLSIRYAPILKALSASHDIDLVQIVSKWAGQMKPGADEGVFRNIDPIIRADTTPSVAQRLFMRGRTLVFPSPPHACFSIDHKQVGEKLQALLAGRHYDIGLWITLGFADLAAPILRKHCHRVVYDAIDSALSGELKKATRNPLTRWDNYWLRRWEQSICREFDRAIYISKSDIDIFTVDAPALRRDIVHLPNGIFHEDRVSEIASIEGIEPDDFVIGFLGHMAYGPNIQAAVRLSRIHQIVRADIPSAKLLIIGRSPTKPVRALADLPGVFVTDTVENIWPYVNRTDAFVFPMEHGAGQQNKVLEAMYAQRPVVATDIANNGVGATPGEEILIGRTDDELAFHIRAIAKDSAFASVIGSRGYEFVQRTYSWDAIIPQFVSTILGEH